MVVFDHTHDQPIFSITVDSNDITSLVNDRLIELIINEYRSDEADQLEITLSDHDGQLQIPEQNATLTVSLGWKSTGFFEKGKFNVDEIEYSGTPDTIILRARSVLFDGQLRTRKERSFHKTTVGEIVDLIAKENDLEAVISDELSSHKIEHIDQTEESDLAFLKRIGKRFDAVVTIKENKLLFVSIHGAKKANGEPMPIVSILRRHGDKHSYSINSRDKYTGVVAFWRDPRSTKKKKITVGVQGNAKNLRENFSSEAEALEAAKAEWQRIRRGTAVMRFTLAAGLPSLIPQVLIKFPDFKAPINQHTWLIKSVSHQLSSNGYITSLDLELEDSKEEQSE